MASKLSIVRTWNGQQSLSAPYELEFSLSAQNGDMLVDLYAPYHNDPAPPFPRGKLEGLHEFESVEIFISGFPFMSDVTETPYLEIQVGPHGHYFLAFFMREADWDNQDTTIDFITPPVIDITHSTRRWHARISIPSYYLPEPFCGDGYSVEWRVNAGAIHGVGEEREYLSAYPLPGPQVNYHQLAAFAPMRLFETLEVRATVDRTKSIAHDKQALTPPKGNSQFNLFSSFVPKTPDPTPVDTVFNVTDELRRAVLEESVLAVEERLSGSAVRNAHAPLPDSPSAQGGAAAAADTGSVATVEDVARQLREELLRSDHQSALSDLSEVFQRHLLKDEFVILHSVVWKRRGLSFKKRKLILTSKPRLVYMTLNGEFKGQISWTMTKRLQLEKVNAQKFDVVVTDPNRRYHFSDSALGSEVWMHVLESLMKAQKQYFTKSRKAV